MGSLTNDQVLGFYLSEIHTPDQLRGGCIGSTLRGSVEGGLVYHRTAGQRRTNFGPVTLCHYLPKQKLFVLNGDAFADASASRWQNNLRSFVQKPPEGQDPWPRQLEVRGATQSRDGRWASSNSVPPRNIPDIEAILLPFQALAGAGIDTTTVVSIHVEEDRWEQVVHPVGNPRTKVGKGWTPVSETRYQRVFEQTISGHRIRYTQTKTSVWTHADGRTTPYRPSWREIEGWTEELVWSDRGTLIVVWGVDINGIGAWRPIQRQNNQARWIERVHHLGGSLFSAASADGRRHRFVSSFDALENPPMYFLAQIPDRARAATVTEAVISLKPPIVAAAEEKGLAVFRQGDVFAIETGLTDDEVYAQAKSRVRRDVVMASVDTNTVARRIADGRSWPEPVKGEVREYLPCPCGCGHKRWVGNGIKAQHSLSIYRTGHTATEVVVGKGGATYIKGSMHHDPRIEEPGRMGEHRVIDLTEGRWFLCVRNTVPRRKQRPEQQEEEAA